MKKGWQTRRLGDVVTRLTNGFVGPTRNIYHESGIPYLLARHVRNNSLLFDGRTFISDEFNRKNKKSMLKAGDVLLVQSGHIGHSAVVTEQHEGHNCHAMIVISPVKDAITGPYLSLFFNSPDMQRGFEEIRSGSTVPHLTCGAVKELQIPVPPLAEQQRIVGLLDEAFAGLATARAAAEKNHQNARALFESHLQSVFTQRGKGWVETTIGDVFTTATGTTPPKNNADFYGDFMPLVKPPELCDAPFDSAPDGLSEAGAAVARTLPEKSILVSCIGNLGKIGLNTVPVAFNQQTNAILPNESQAIPEFMFFQSLAPAFKEQLESLASGTTVPIVNKSKFNSVRVVLPPLPIQKAVVAQLTDLREETQRLATLYARKQAALAALKQSLLHQAFAGEL